MLIEHRGEAEYDFRNLLTVAYRFLVETDVEETLRLTRQILRNPGSRLAAAVAEWDAPFSVSDFMFASLFRWLTGDWPPQMPDVQDRSISEAETRLADMALERMNRR